LAAWRRLRTGQIRRSAAGLEATVSDFSDQILRKLGRKTVLVATLRTGSFGDREG